MDYANVEINKNGNWGIVTWELHYLLNCSINLRAFLRCTSVKELNDLTITHKVPVILTQSAGV